MAELGLGKLCFSKNNGMLAYHKNLGNLIFKGAGGGSSGGGDEGGGEDFDWNKDQYLFSLWIESYPSDFVPTYIRKEDYIQTVGSFTYRNLGGKLADLYFLPNDNLWGYYGQFDRYIQKLNYYYIIKSVESTTADYGLSYDELFKKYSIHTNYDILRCSDEDYKKPIHAYNDWYSGIPYDDNIHYNKIYIQPGKHIEIRNDTYLCWGGRTNINSSPGYDEIKTSDLFSACNNKNDYIMKCLFNGRYYYSSISFDTIMQKFNSASASDSIFRIVIGIFFHKNNTITFKTEMLTQDEWQSFLNSGKTFYFDDLPA